jgi:hypothetical protein
MILMGHTLEDRLYYARLWVMEVEGELLKLQEDHATARDVAALQAELERAHAHLQARIAQE